MIVKSETAAADLHALLISHRLRMDVQYPGELRDLFESPAVRRMYFGRRGLTIDGLIELMIDRGIIADTPAPTANEVLEFVGQLATAPAKKTAKRVRRNVALSGIERDAKRAKTNRNKVFRCPECGRTRCNGAVKTCDVICGPCYRSTGVIVFLKRGEPTFAEVMNQTAAACEATPF